MLKFAVSVRGFTVQRFKVDQKFKPCITTIALYDLKSMPDSPTLAAMVSLSTSQPMSKTKERKLTLNIEPFSTVNGYNLFKPINILGVLHHLMAGGMDRVDIL